MEEAQELPQGDAPALAVVIVVGDQRKRATSAVRSVIDQNVINQIEILLFDLGPEDCPPLEGSDHPRVRFTRRGPNDLLAIARADGVFMARAPIVAFMEEHVQAQPGWAEAIIAAHAGPWAGVSAAFICGNPHSGRSDQAFRLTYGIYVYGGWERGQKEFIAGQNSAYKRAVLMRYRDELSELLNADHVLQCKINRDGGKLFYEPRARLAHHSENTVIGLCAGTFYWNWCYANLWRRSLETSAVLRACRLLLFPVIPWVRLAKVFRQICWLGGPHVLQFFLDIPVLLTVHYAAAAGQAAGLVNPLDVAARRFSHLEINEPRLLATELAG